MAEKPTMIESHQQVNQQTDQSIHPKTDVQTEYAKWKNNKALESLVRSRASKNPKVQYDIANILCRYFLLQHNFPEDASKHLQTLTEDLQKKKIRISLSDLSVFPSVSSGLSPDEKPEFWSCGSRTIFKFGSFKLSLPRSRYAKWEHLSPDTIFKMLLRYHSIFCENGNFWSLHPTICSVIQQRYHAQIECFSSPLNSNFSMFCSLFPDVDSDFGSIGNFFHSISNFGPGTYMANPPFIEDIMNRSVSSILNFLDTHEATFFMYLPQWTDCQYIRDLNNSKWLVDLHPLPKGQHRTYDHIKDIDIVAYFDAFLVVVSSHPDPYCGNKQYLLDAVAHH